MKPSTNLFMLSGRITYLTFKKTKTDEDMFVMGLSVPYRAWQIRRDTKGKANQISVSGFKDIVPYAKKNLQKEDFVTITGDITSSAVKNAGKKKLFGMRIWLVVRTIKPLFRGDGATPHTADPWIGKQGVLEKPQTAESHPLLADDLS